jgi:predicted XRE-type DNA-binding protein
MTAMPANEKLQKSTAKLNSVRDAIAADPERNQRVEQRVRGLLDGLVLTEIRQQRHLTQREVASRLSVTQANVSRIEHQENIYLSTLSAFIGAVGGRLKIEVEFSDGGKIELTEPEPLISRSEL